MRPGTVPRGVTGCATPGAEGGILARTRAALAPAGKIRAPGQGPILGAGRRAYRRAASTIAMMPARTGPGRSPQPSMTACRSAGKL